MDIPENKMRKALVTLATAAAGEIIAEILGKRYDEGARNFQYVGPAYIGLVVTPDGLRTDLYDKHNGIGAAERALVGETETADTEPPPPPESEKEPAKQKRGRKKT